MTDCSKMEIIVLVTLLATVALLALQNHTNKNTIMSAITDWAAQEQADLTDIKDTLTGVVSGIAALDKLITDFQNSPGTLSPADQAALDGIKAASGALVTQAHAINVTPPPPPAA